MPFKASAIRYRNGQVHLAGLPLSLWDSYGLAVHQLGAGNLSEDARGRWFLNVTVKVPAKPRAVDPASLEAAAHALGAPNWDTLSGRLNAAAKAAPAGKQISAPVLAAPVQLFLEVPGSGDDMDGPRWCRLTLSNQVLAVMQKLHGMSQEAGRKFAMGLGNDTQWDNSSGYLEVESDEVSVNQGAIRLRGEYRHDSGGPTTVLLPLAALYRALETRSSPSSDFQWVDGALYLASDDALEFAAVVAETADEALLV